MATGNRRVPRTYIPIAGEVRGVRTGLEPLNTVQSAAKLDQARAKLLQTPQAVSLPPHLFIPAGSQSIDIRKVVNLAAGSVDYELFRFTAPEGAVTKFISYGIFNDGLLGVDFNFKPLVDGSRVFPYHGDPSDNYRIYLGLGPDLSEVSMIKCQLGLLPGQTIVWYLSNTSAVDVAMGVRMAGYFDTSEQITTPRFGG
jgi:hypothetical protein